jgi:hypothetical protein
MKPYAMGIVGSYHADEREIIVKTQQSSDQLHDSTRSLNFGPTTACQQISSKLSDHVLCFLRDVSCFHDYWQFGKPSDLQ